MGGDGGSQYKLHNSPQAEKKKNVATGQGTKKSVWQESSNQGKKKASEWRGSQEPYHTGPHRSFK